MKIRKGLLAAATTATVSISGVVAAPAFAAGDITPNSSTGAVQTQAQDGQENGTEEQSFGDKLKEGSSDDEGNWDPKKITLWIRAFSAILGLIGSVITFAQKNFDFPQF